MNLSTLAFALIAWQMFSNTQNTPKNSGLNLSDFLSADTKNMLDCISQLSKGGNSEKLGAILQMMSNPKVMDIAQNFFGKQTAKPQEPKPQETPPFTNSEGYNFETPSAESREFFKPVENIADAEVKSKLYWFYDNWYLK